MPSCCARLRSVPVGLRQEDRRHRQIDAGAVEVERIAGRHDQADDAISRSPAFSSLAIIRGSTDSEDDVPSTISSSSWM